jgi:hypothetical protein
MRYLINESDLTAKSQWRKSAFNRLFLSILALLKRIQSVSATRSAGENGIIPFSRQEFERAFTYEFTHWRCGRQDGDNTKKPIVWDTDQNRMLHRKTFGRCRIVDISDSGSVPRVDEPIAADRERILSLLGSDEFPTCICSGPNNKSVLRLLAIKMGFMHVLETRPANTTAPLVFKKNAMKATVASTIIDNGVAFEDFFSSSSKAAEYVASKCTSVGLTGTSINTDNTYVGTKRSTWDLVFANCSREPIHYLGWLKRPGTSPRPTMSLFEGYNQEDVNRLNTLINEGKNDAIMTLVSSTGVLTTELIRYLKEMRDEWELNRYLVALKFDQEDGDPPTKAEVEANVDFMSNMGLTRHREKALIVRKK